RRSSPSTTSSSSPSPAVSITSPRSPTAPSRASFEVVPQSWMTTSREEAHSSKSAAKRWFVTRWTASTSSTPRTESRIQSSIGRGGGGGGRGGGGRWGGGCVLVPCVVERPNPRAVAGREQDGLHRRDSLYGGRWTPFSVTIAVISWAGGTSEGGVRVGTPAGRC